MPAIPKEQRWIRCDVEPDDPGWYEVQRFDEYNAPYKMQCKKLYWTHTGWFYDEDACVPAKMSVETGDCWKATPLLLM